MNIEILFMEKCHLFIKNLREDIFNLYSATHNLDKFALENLEPEQQHIWKLMLRKNEHIYEDYIFDFFTLSTILKKTDYLSRKGIINADLFILDLNAVCKCRNKIAHRNQSRISHEFVMEALMCLEAINRDLRFPKLITDNEKDYAKADSRYRDPYDDVIVKHSQLRTMFIVFTEQIQFKYIHHSFFHKFDFNKIFQSPYYEVLINDLNDIDYEQFERLISEEQSILETRNALFHFWDDEPIDYEWASNWIFSMCDLLSIDIKRILTELEHRRSIGDYFKNVI